MEIELLYFINWCAKVIFIWVVFEHEKLLIHKFPTAKSLGIVNNAAGNVRVGCNCPDTTVKF
jgi:hypothetical protein